MNDDLLNGCIPKDSIVTMTKTNHIIEVQYLEKCNNQLNIKRLDNENYIVLSTGEQKKFKKSNKRLDNLNSFRQTFKKLRYLINNNFTGLKNELFVTLTYAENMTDTKRLYFDLKNFLKRLRYEYRHLSKIDYIIVIEPQKRGAWHAHILLKFIDVENIYIENKDMAKIWGFGFVNVRAISTMGVDNIGAYLTAYLTDLPVDNINDKKFDKFKNNIHLKKVNNKYYLKGERLKLYPKGMNFYRCSRGIKYPDRFKIPYSDIKKYVGDSKPTYSFLKTFKTDDFDNLILYEYYNLKRQ